MIAPAVTRSMVAQVDRVNARRSAADRIAELEAEVARLRAVIADQREQLAAFMNADVPVGTTQGSSAPNTWQGRPALTAAQAADRAGVSVATVHRYVASGHWQGDLPRRGVNRLVVYADQELKRKGKRK